MLRYNVCVTVTLSSSYYNMPLNIPGILVPFQLLIYPRLVIPSLVVKGKVSPATPDNSDPNLDRKISAKLTFLR